ncbi:MAG: hypothetical protein OEY03_07110 [Rhizobacter sp.]|nr:hypothetical protein [Rhizobacter sp.]
MNRSIALTVWFSSLCLAFSAVAQQAAPAPAESAASAASAPETLQPKIAPLLTFILGRVITAAVKADADKPDGLFSKLKNQLGFGDKPEQTAAKDEGALTPAVGYALQQLDPASFDVLAALKVGEGPTVLKTGDVFAVQYSTNLPGKIRLENVDPMGRVSDLGTYTVLVDQLNRLPSEKGIRLQGEPGLELLRLYFLPCLPPEAADQPWAAQFEAQLPKCGGRADMQVATAKMGTGQTRSLVNLAQPDATMAFAGVTEYRMNEVTMAVVQILHERPGDGK